MHVKSVADPPPPGILDCPHLPAHALLNTSPQPQCYAQSVRYDKEACEAVTQWYDGPEKPVEESSSPEDSLSDEASAM